MAAITTVTGTQYPFDIVEGQVLPLQPVPDIFNRLGQIGSGVQIVATRAESSEVIGHALFASLDLARKFRDGIAGVQGSMVKYDDPVGYSGMVLVRSVSARVMAGRYSAGSNLNAAYRVEAMMTLEAQS